MSLSPADERDAPALRVRVDRDRVVCAVLGPMTPRCRSALDAATEIAVSSGRVVLIDLDRAGPPTPDDLHHLGALLATYGDLVEVLRPLPDPAALTPT
jgi:hypothetical protein